MNRSATKSEVGRATDRLVRLAYARLVAWLASEWHDVAAAEDALGDALRAALEAWPRTGIPERPEAWLLVAARRRLLDAVRARRVRAAAMGELESLAEPAAPAPPPVPDRRLALLFVCTHPVIDEGVRTPLMLQTVLGLDAARIASCFLVAPATMGQRLVRAKARLRDAGTRFVVPEPDAFPARAVAVREAIYAAYGTGWDALGTTDPVCRGLTDEAIWLARVLVETLPDDAEAKGLLSLMLFCESRRQARRSQEGRFVPLAEQDPALWERTMVTEAEALLTAAVGVGDAGRFQLEAAIQSAVVDGARTGRPPRQAILALHTALVAVAPTIGNALARIAALADVAGAEAGLAALTALPEATVATYQPYWAVRAHLLRLSGDEADAQAAYERAAALTDDPAVRAFLLGRTSH
ncbi:MAG: DUF6596 domain-containing protein [Pseudomonadota bacterium]